MGIGQIIGEKLVLSGFLSRWVPSYAISSDVCIGKETWDIDEIKENETSSWNVLKGKKIWGIVIFPVVDFNCGIFFQIFEWTKYERI